MQSVERFGIEAALRFEFLFIAQRCARPTSIGRGRSGFTNPPITKTAHHGIERNIYTGPRAQEVIAPFLMSRPIGSYLFSPIDADKEATPKRNVTAGRTRKPNPRKTGP